MKITLDQPEAAFVALGTCELSDVGKAPRPGTVIEIHSGKWDSDWREDYHGALARTNESAIRKLPQGRVNAHVGTIRVKEVLCEKVDGAIEWSAWSDMQA